MSETIFDNLKPFKNNEKCFLFHIKSSFRSQDILCFCTDFLSLVAKRLDWKDKINFEIYDVTAW